MTVGSVLSGWEESFDRLAQARGKAGLTRRLRPRSPDDAVVDLAGNDYLGLAAHPAVVGAAASALTAYGLGATGSRLVRGSTDEHAALETELSETLGTQVSVAHGRGGKGRLVIHYSDLDTLDGVLERLRRPV